MATVGAVIDLLIAEIGDHVFRSPAEPQPALGWYEWMWKQLAIAVAATFAVALCFPVYFGLKEPPRHE